MYEVTIKIKGFKGVTKHLFTSKAKAEKAAANANATANVSASYTKLF